MPMCEYQGACTRKGCVYRHPDKAAPAPKSGQVCMPYLSHLCMYGRGCYNVHPPTEEADAMRAKFASKPCQFWEKCLTEGCLYAHPPPVCSFGAECGRTDCLFCNQVGPSRHAPLLHD